MRDVLSRVPPLASQVVVVDNGSTDRTSEVARSMGATVVFEPRRGYGRAYKTGFAAATGDIVVTLDGDGSYPPEAAPALIEHLASGELDFISACRFPLSNAAAMNLKHRLGNWALTFVTKLLFWPGVRDSQSGMWVFRRRILDSLKLTSDGMALSEEIKIEAIKRGFRFAEHHIAYQERLGEIKLHPWRDGVINLLFLFRKRFD